MGDYATGEPEPFEEVVTFVAKPRRFVVANDIYIPGYMLGDRDCRRGDVVYGEKLPSASGRMSFRATTIESVEPGDGVSDVSSDPADLMSSLRRSVSVSSGSEQDYGRDDCSEEAFSPERQRDMASLLRSYIDDNGGAIKMAGPPSTPGSLAHFYSKTPDAAALIKGFEFTKSKAGIQAFTKAYPSMFAIAGRHPAKQLVAKNKENGANGAAAKGGGKGGGGKAAQAAQANGVAAGVEAAAAAAKPLARQLGGMKISSAAMAAQAKAQAASSANGGAAADSQNAAMQEELVGLSADLATASSALAQAHERMRKLWMALDKKPGGASSTA